MNTKEFHPFLNEGKIEGAKGLILGSFPVFACTEPDISEKEKIRKNEGTIRFFYGSSKSRFWSLYRQHIDSNVTDPVNRLSAIASLRKNEIAISDTITSCRRKGISSSDSDLSDRVYNVDMIQQMIQDGVSKVLCTSKGVLFDLDSKIICSFSEIKLDIALTKTFSDNFLSDINGKLPAFNRGIGFVYSFNHRLIYALAIPSPGSPQRQAHNFGCTSKDKLGYVNNYFEKAFNWLKND
jgi:hypothetical protein